MPQDTAAILPIVIAVLVVGLALRRRIRRTFGQQPIAPKRMALRMVLLAAVASSLLAWMPSAPAFAAAGAGAAIGVALAFYALAHTQYLTTAAGRFYIPNKWTGVLVTALLVGRLAARLIVLYEHRDVLGADSSIPRSPLTVGVFFVLAAYYIAYYAGVLRSAANSPAPADGSAAAKRPDQPTRLP